MMKKNDAPICEECDANTAEGEQHTSTCFDAPGIVDDTAAPVTEDDLAEVERLDAQATPGPWDESVPRHRDYESPAVHHRGDADDGCLAKVWGPQANAALIARARTLLPRLARDLRTIDTLIDEAGIGRRGPEDTIADRLRRLIADANEIEADRDALAENVERTIERDYLVNRDHQRLEDRVLQAEAERDRARAVAAQAEALMQDRERLMQQVRGLKDRYDDLRTEAGKAACAPAEEREDACRMLAAALEQL